MTKWVETLCPKLAFKRRKYSFPPIPSMQCCANVRATYRKQQTSQLWTEGTGNGCAFFCSLKLPHLSCRQLSESQEWPYIPKKINSTHFLMLGRKTHGGFLCQFDFIMPILEQLECGDFVIFSVMLNMPWHRAMWCIEHNFLFSPLWKKKTKWKG